MDNQIQNNIYVEFVIKRPDMLPAAPPHVRAIVDEYKHHNSDERVVFTVPCLWHGFADGGLADVLQTFGEFLYYALAYVTNDRSEIVTDFFGGSVDCYDVTLDGIRKKKYVKKRLRIMRVLDIATGTFDMKGFMLDLTAQVPVVKVLDVFSVGAESNLGYAQFVKKSVFDEWSRS
jgi:hypothetical protein